MFRNAFRNFDLLTFELNNNDNIETVSYLIDRVLTFCESVLV